MSSDAEIKDQIAQRNAIRESRLPLLGEREFAKLEAARAERIFEAVFASERARFSRNWTTKEGWFAGLSEYSMARKTVREELQMGQHIDIVLKNLGYKLVEDYIQLGKRLNCEVARIYVRNNLVLLSTCVSCRCRVNARS